MISFEPVKVNIIAERHVAKLNSKKACHSNGTCSLIDVRLIRKTQETLLVNIRSLRLLLTLSLNLSNVNNTHCTEKCQNVGD